MEFLGLSLQKDSNRGEMIWRIKAKPKTNDDYISCGVTSIESMKVKADIAAIDEQPNFYESLYTHDTDYFMIPFNYVSSRYVHPDEMNVLHSSAELPKELEISFDFEFRFTGSNFESQEYECTFSSVFALRENSAEGTVYGYINGDTETSMKPKQ